MAQKLTDAIIRKEPAPDKGSKPLYDTEVKGFGCRIYAPTKRNPDGSRSFFLNYHANGIERRYTIGESPTWNVKDARAEAAELRKRIDRGEDPARDKRERRTAPCIEDLVNRYLTDHLPTKAAYGGPRENDERKMAAELADGLGRQTKVADVHFADIERLHRKITASGRPVRANRILALASKAFSLALVPGTGEQDPWRSAIAGNPCKGVKKNPEQARERFFNEAELAAIADALDLADERSSADCIRLVMATGCRPCEAMRARWSEFDAEPGRWVKPSSHTKQRRTHRVPLRRSRPRACRQSSQEPQRRYLAVSFQAKSWRAHQAFAHGLAHHAPAGNTLAMGVRSGRRSSYCGSRGPARLAAYYRGNRGRSEDHESRLAALTCRSASLYPAAFIRGPWRGKPLEPAHDRPAAWPLSKQNDSALCPPG